MINAHVFRLVYVDMDVYASSCLFQTMEQGFGFGRCIRQKRYVIGVVRVCVSIQSADFTFLFLYNIIMAVPVSLGQP